MSENGWGLASAVWIDRLDEVRALAGRCGARRATARRCASTPPASPWPACCATPPSAPACTDPAARTCSAAAATAPAADDSAPPPARSSRPSTPRARAPARSRSASSSPTASSAIIRVVYGTSGTALCPAPRLSNVITRYRSAQRRHLKRPGQMIPPKPHDHQQRLPAPTLHIVQLDPIDPHLRHLTPLPDDPHARISIRSVSPLGRRPDALTRAARARSRRLHEQRRDGVTDARRRGRGAGWGTGTRPPPRSTGASFRIATAGPTPRASWSQPPTRLPRPRRRSAERLRRRDARPHLARDPVPRRDLLQAPARSASTTAPAARSACGSGSPTAD